MHVIDSSFQRQHDLGDISLQVNNIILHYTIIMDSTTWMDGMHLFSTKMQDIYDITQMVRERCLLVPCTQKYVAKLEVRWSEQHLVLVQ